MKFDLDEQRVRRMQRIKMRKLKEHYKIEGGDDAYPISGVGADTSLPWYELALAIATKLDDSLKVVDARPPGITTRRWSGGAEGRILLREVDELKQKRPDLSVRWCLQKIHKKKREIYGQMSFEQLEACYYQAKKHHDKQHHDTMKRASTKRARNKGRGS
jgi:hypothetical protein